MKRRIIIKVTFNTFEFNDNRFSQDWIAERMRIFQSYTLQSLINQVDQSFLALVEYEKCTERYIYHELNKYPPLPDNIKFVSNADAHINKAIKGYNHLYLVRLDSDDMYNKTFIRQLHRYTPQKTTAALINQHGFIYDTINKRLGIYYDSSPPFYVLIYRVRDYINGKRYKLHNGHTDVIRLPHEILPGSNYLVTVHSRNTETRFENCYFTKEIITDEDKAKSILKSYFNIG